MASSQKHGRVKSIISDVGRPLKYLNYSPLGHKKHYWGEPSKNYGFYTSQQIEFNSRRIQTEGLYQKQSRYQSRKQGNFIVNLNNPQEFHCCTCHNNPHRYKNNAEKCKFCQQFTKKRQFFSFNKSNDQTSKRKYKTIQVDQHKQDKNIQVSLPRIHRHNEKREQNCQACRQKKKNRLQINDNASGLRIQRSAKTIQGNHSQSSFIGAFRKKLTSKLKM